MQKLRTLLRGPGLAALLLTCTYAMPHTAEATVVKMMSLLEKTESAPVVVYGSVERVSTEWAVYGAQLQTLITIKVIEGIKGGSEAGDLLVVTRGGGRLGDFHQTAPGLVEYKAGQEVVLFLEPLGAHLVAIGIGIGTYPIEQRGADRWVTHNPKVAGVRFNAKQPMRVERIQAMTPEPLDRFLKRVRSYARNISTEPVVRPRKGARLKNPPQVIQGR